MSVICTVCDKSGLTQKSRDSKISVSDAERELLQFVKQYAPASACPLAGNSVHVDKLFLTRYMPDFVQHLHYRIVDVSTIKELCRWGLLKICITGCGRKNGPLKFFVVFSANVWDFNMKFYSFVL